jgi:hypothetical protein
MTTAKQAISAFNFKPFNVMTDAAQHFMRGVMDDTIELDVDSSGWGWNYEYSELIGLVEKYGQQYDVEFPAMKHYENVDFSSVKYVAFEDFIHEADRRAFSMIDFDDDASFDQGKYKVKHVVRHVLVWDAKEVECKTIRDHRGRIEVEDAQHRALVYWFDETIHEFHIGSYVLPSIMFLMNAELPYRDVEFFKNRTREADTDMDHDTVRNIAPIAMRLLRKAAEAGDVAEMSRIFNHCSETKFFIDGNWTVFARGELSHILDMVEELPDVAGKGELLERVRECFSFGIQYYTRMLEKYSKMHSDDRDEAHFYYGTVRYYTGILAEVNGFDVASLVNG